MQKFVLIVLAALGTLGVFAAGTLAPTAALAETFSREVGVPLQDAKKAMDRRQWDQAAAHIKKADGIASKKPHEQYQINEMLGYVALQQKDYATAIRANEANLASGRVPPAEMPARLKSLTTLYVATRNWPKVVEYGNRWAKASPGDVDAQFQVAQAQYQMNDCKSATRNMQGAIDAAQKAGQTPKENWLNLKLECQNRLQDKAGMVATREQLVRYYPNKNNWKAVLVNVYNQPNNDDRATLNVFRLMNELDVLERKEDYVEMAQMAIETGASPEAVTVLEKGFANKTLEGKERDRHVRLLNNAKAQAQAVPGAIAKLEEEAKASATGDPDVRLGSRYLASGQYDKAVDSITRGLKKGGVTGSDEAQMMLGRAYLKLKQKDQARKAFRAVPDDSKLAQVAQLWGVYATQS